MVGGVPLQEGAVFAVPSFERRVLEPELEQLPGELIAAVQVDFQAVVARRGMAEFSICLVSLYSN
jgi:hypothetical protein